MYRTLSGTSQYQEPGYYRQDISKRARARALPAGVYFLTLTQGDSRVTSRVTLVE